MVKNPLRAIVGIGFFQALAMAFLLLRSKLVAVLLGPTGVGAISLVDHVALLVGQICSVSLPFAAVKFLSAAHGGGPRRFANLFVALVRALLVVSIAGTLIAVAVLVLRPQTLGAELEAYTDIAILALLAIPATNVFTLLTNAMAAATRARASAAYGVANSAAAALLCAAGALLGGLRGYYVGNLAAVMAIVAGGLVFLDRREGLRASREPVSVRDELRGYPQVAGFAASLYVLSFTMPVAHLIARYAVLQNEGLAGAGLLQASMAVGLALSTVMRQSNALLLTPAMNRNDPAREKFLHAIDYLRALTLASALLAAPLVLFPRWWLALLYSHEFLAAAPYAYLFVVAYTVQVIAGVNIALLIGLDHIATQVWITLCGLVALALLAWLLVPHIGIAGVAAGMLANAGLLFVLSAWRLRAEHGFAVYRALGWQPFAMLAMLLLGGRAAMAMTDDATTIALRLVACAGAAALAAPTLLRQLPRSA